MRTAHALLAAFLMVPFAATAKTVTARGEGAAPCSAWTEEHEKRTSRRPVQDSWILGYVNAAAAMLEFPGIDDVSASFRNRDLVTWIDDYCSANPDKPLIIAADALMRYLARRAQGPEQQGPRTFDP
jgi:hypothetical protein